MENNLTEKSEREHLQKRFPKLTKQDFNDLYSLYPFTEYHSLNRVKTLIYWYECLGEKKETILNPHI